MHRKKKIITKPPQWKCSLARFVETQIKKKELPDFTAFSFLPGGADKKVKVSYLFYLFLTHPEGAETFLAILLHMNV